MENKRVVGIYVRVSTQGQVDEGYSVDEQTEKLKKYCDVKDWKVGKVYTDGGFSGSNINRPALQLMIDDIKAKKINTVLVYKLDRLSRSQKDTLYLIEDVFNEHGVAFISLNENFDTSTAFGKAMIGILSVFAQLEREQITMRMQMGRVGRAKAGLYNGGAQKPFGYDYKDDKLTVNPITAPIVQAIFKDYLDGMSLTHLTQKYNRNGHIGRKKGWSYHSMGYLLRNRHYIGEVSWRQKWYLGKQDPLIDRDEFEEVQKQLEIRRIATEKANNNTRPFRAQFMLSGLMRCGLCGGRMEVGKTVLKSGRSYHYYACRYSKPKNLALDNKLEQDPCTLPKYNMQALEKMVIERIMTLAYDSKKIKKIADQRKPIRDNLIAVQKQVEQINHSLNRLMDLYSEGNIPLEQINAKAEELNLEKTHLNEHAQEITKEMNKKPTATFKKSIAMARNKLEVSDYETQKTIVRQLIKKIILNNDEITIEWRF